MVGLRQLSGVWIRGACSIQVYLSVCFGKLLTGPSLEGVPGASPRAVAGSHGNAVEGRRQRGGALANLCSAREGRRTVGREEVGVGENAASLEERSWSSGQVHPLLTERSGFQSLASLAEKVTRWKSATSYHQSRPYRAGWKSGLKASSYMVI